MLYLIGLGLKPKHLSIEALDAIRQCDQVFVDTYTSFYSEGSLAELEKLTEKKIHAFSRSQIEEGSEKILSIAKSNKVALLVFGNPLTATTHVQLLLDAKKMKVKTQVIEGISVTNALARTGLDEYRFGRTVTIPEPKQGFEPDSFYGFIEQNNKLGLHTLCLLDTGDGHSFMDTKKALEVLEKTEKKNKKSMLQKAIIVLISGLTSENEKIFAGTLKDAKKILLTGFPQSLIICGKLTEKEKEALRELHGFGA